MNDLLLEKGFTVILKKREELQEAFLLDASVCDMAVIPLDDDYMDFLAKVQAKRIHGPILFISPEPLFEQKSLQQFHAFILDQKRMGAAEMKKTVSFILSLALSRIPAELPQPFTLEECACTTDEGPKEANVDITTTLSTLMRDGVRVVVAFQILEDGEPVTVRGTCFLKTVTDNAIVLSRFKPLPLLQGARQGMEIAMLFTLGDNRYHATVKAQGTGEDELIASFPERLFFVRRRFFRIEPSPPRPVNISVLLPHAPTSFLKAQEISQRGISFMGPGSLEQGRVYAFTIVLPEPTTVIGSYGIIRSKREHDNGFRYGAELHIHPRDEEDISRYIMRRELQILSLLNEK